MPSNLSSTWILFSLSTFGAPPHPPIPSCRLLLFQICYTQALFTLSSLTVLCFVFLVLMSVEFQAWPSIVCLVRLFNFMVKFLSLSDVVIWHDSITPQGTRFFRELTHALLAVHFKILSFVSKLQLCFMFPSSGYHLKQLVS